MTDKKTSEAARALSNMRKRKVGGFKDKHRAKEAARKSHLARRRKKEAADKAVEDLKI